MSTEEKDQATKLTEAAMAKAENEKLWATGEAICGLQNQIVGQLQAAGMIKLSFRSKARALALEVLFNEAMNGVTVAEFCRLVEEAKTTEAGKRLLSFAARERATGDCRCDDPGCPDAEKKKPKAQG